MAAAEWLSFFRTFTALGLHFASRPAIFSLIVNLPVNPTGPQLPPHHKENT